MGGSAKDGIQPVNLPEMSELLSDPSIDRYENGLYFAGNDNHLNYDLRIRLKAILL
jgi:hypothetical protein